VIALSAVLGSAVDTALSVVTGPNDGETVGVPTSLVVTGPNEAEVAVEGVPISVCPEVTALSTGRMVVGSPVPELVSNVTGVSTGCVAVSTFVVVTGPNDGSPLEGVSEDAIGIVVVPSDRVAEGTASVKVAAGAISVVCPFMVVSTVSEGMVVGCATSV
jgi:hypothetical protein